MKKSDQIKTGFWVGLLKVRRIAEAVARTGRIKAWRTIHEYPVHENSICKNSIHENLSHEKSVHKNSRHEKPVNKTRKFEIRKLGTQKWSPQKFKTLANLFKINFLKKKHF